jgi:hypothetical protein
MDDETRAAGPEPAVTAEVITTSRELIQHARAAILRARRIRARSAALIGRGKGRSGSAGVVKDSETT